MSSSPGSPKRPSPPGSNRSGSPTSTLTCGVRPLRWEAAPDDPGGAAERRALQTLTHPGLMGADFQACLFGRGFPFEEARTGFALRNRVSLLGAGCARVPV